MIFMAIDASLSSTGYCIRDLSTSSLISTGVITTKHINYKNDFAGMKRIQYIIEQIILLVEKYHPLQVVLEDLNLGIRKSRSISVLAGLNYIIRFVLKLKNLPYFMMPPGSWKILYLNNGAAKKEEILEKVINDFKHLHLSKKNQDVADAIGISEAYKFYCEHKKDIENIDKRHKICIRKLTDLQEVKL